MKSPPYLIALSSGGKFSGQRKQDRFSIDSLSTLADVLLIRPGLCWAKTRERSMMSAFVSMHSNAEYPRARRGHVRFCWSIKASIFTTRSFRSRDPGASPISRSLNSRSSHFTVISPLSSKQLYGPHAIFIRVIAVGGSQSQGGIGIPFPPAGIINGLVDSPDLVAPADSQSGRVVLPVARVRQSYLPQNGDEKTSGRSQPVDSEGVVSPVLASPFAVIDQPRRDFVQVEIDNLVRTDDHRVRALVEFRDHLFERVRAGVEIVRIK